MNESRKKFMSGLLILVMIAVFIGIIVTLANRMGVPRIEANTYQSVFLDNNQQYFGHLNNINSDFPYLSDIYYVRLQQAANTSNPTLIKLGGEIHGPEDIMYLNWDKVLFWENLRADSQVVKGIMQEKAQRATQAQSPTVQQQPVVQQPVVPQAQPGTAQPAPAAPAPAPAAPAPVQ